MWSVSLSGISLPGNNFFLTASPSSVESPLDLEGPLALNNYLDNSEHLLEGRLAGPEHLLIIGKDIYTGLSTGEVVRINGNQVTVVTRFGETCDGIWEESKCGRPLGMVYDAGRNYLIVADGYFGIWEVDVKSGAKKQLVSPDTIIQGDNPRKAAIFNSVALHSSGDIFFTDASSDFQLEDGLFTMMANPSGRLIHWDRKRNVATTLIDQLALANGLLLSPDEDFVVVSELQRARILKYHLKGPKKGTHEPFISGLPGHPDNLTPSTNGFWIALVASRDSENPSLMASLGQVPLVRKFFIRMMYLIGLPFKLIHKVVPSASVQRLIHKWGHLDMFSAAFPARQTLIKVDWNGKIVGALHTMDKSVHAISHVVEDGDYLYMGGPFLKYIGRIKLSAEAQALVGGISRNTEPSQPPPTVTPKSVAKEPAPVHEKDPIPPPPITRKGEGEL